LTLHTCVSRLAQICVKDLGQAPAKTDEFLHPTHARGTMQTRAQSSDCTAESPALVDERDQTDSADK
jgi:hypothetical protein